MGWLNVHLKGWILLEAQLLVPTELYFMSIRSRRSKEVGTYAVNDLTTRRIQLN